MNAPVPTKCFHELDAALGAWALGLVDPGRLPDLATAALGRGFDSPTLRLLAGATPNDDLARSALWEQAVREIGLTVPDKRSAATTYATCVARLIVSGEISPYEGAKALWRASISVDDPDFHELDSFIYASSEYEDRPADRAFFEEMILQEAQQWSLR